MSKKANKKKITRGKRYTPAKKAKVLSYVNSVNAEKGRGGAAAASRKFGISQITIGQWVKKSGIPTPAGKTKTKATKAATSTVPSGFSKKLKRLESIHQKLSKKEAEINALKSEYEALKKSL